MLENDNKVLRYEAVLVGCYSTGFCLAILKAQNHFSKENIFLSSICQVYYNCHGDFFFFKKKSMDLRGVFRTLPNIMVKGSRPFS